MSDLADYRETVESIARDVIENEGIDESNWHDYIHESVDGSAFIIYYGKNEVVLEATDNEPDNDEVASMCDPKGSWRDMRQTAAYLAMERDVWDKARELVEEYTPVSFKLQKQDGTFLKVGDVTEEGLVEDDCQQYEELTFQDLDEAKEAAENFETANEGQQIKVVPFNDDDNVIEIDLELLEG